MWEKFHVDVKCRANVNCNCSQVDQINHIKCLGIVMNKKLEKLRQNARKLQIASSKNMRTFYFLRSFMSEYL